MYDVSAQGVDERMINVHYADDDDDDDDDVSHDGNSPPLIDMYAWSWCACVKMYAGRLPDPLPCDHSIFLP